MRAAASNQVVLTFPDAPSVFLPDCNEGSRSGMVRLLSHTKLTSFLQSLASQEQFIEIVGSELT